MPLDLITSMRISEVKEKETGGDHLLHDCTENFRQCHFHDPIRYCLSDPTGRVDTRIAENGSIETASDEVVSTTSSGLTMPVLEAVAFGSLPWDAESYVESK
ncbi:hypothetical protein D5086_001230 [Populus alba]|uniref:Uncharacterized protein n=1 Tax=Populus alba TaxID=43335 RepID=A0ACC4CZ99_POPAL